MHQSVIAAEQATILDLRPCSPGLATYPPEAGNPACCDDVMESAVAPCRVAGAQQQCCSAGCSSITQLTSSIRTSASSTCASSTSTSSFFSFQAADDSWDDVVMSVSSNIAMMSLSSTPACSSSSLATVPGPAAVPHAPHAGAQLEAEGWLISTAVCQAGGQCGSSGALYDASSWAEDSDPLLVAAHAAIAAAMAASAAGTNTSAADAYTLVSADGDAVLLLGHASTTISASPSRFPGLRGWVAEQEQRQQQQQHEAAAAALCQLAPLDTPRQRQQCGGQQPQGRRVSSGTSVMLQLDATGAGVAPDAGGDKDSSRSVLILGTSGSITAPQQHQQPLPVPVPVPQQQHQRGARHNQLGHGTSVVRQPVMQLLSCSTLLSPVPSSSLLAGVFSSSHNSSCLRIGSVTSLPLCMQSCKRLSQAGVAGHALAQQQQDAPQQAHQQQQRLMYLLD